MFRQRSYQPMLAVIAMSTVVVALLLLPRSIHVPPEADGWVDQLKAVVLYEQTREPPVGTFAPYLGQLELVRHLVRSGDHPGAYLVMNRFMDMLEARVGGISDAAAEAIWDSCYEITPARYHDVSRHLRADRKRLERIQAQGEAPIF